jgi:2-keto-4-pentenoate hydratase/2-oxohepta-3-ene-1,7-dioic acid hydratase in catechol pathway
MHIARVVVGDEEPRFGVVTGQEESTAEAVVALVQGDPLFQPLQLTGERIPLAETRLLAPVIPRSKVVGVGRNYPDHADEMGARVPGEPLLFLKPNTAVIGPDAPVVLPEASTEVHHEGELAVVIGRMCKDVPIERAGEVIFGYTCANDVTARDLQREDGQWTRAKGFDTFCPVGPWIATRLDPSDVVVETRVNDELRQSGCTSDLVHSVAQLVSFVSSVFTLLPGDVILTGTPAGVGPLQAGDRVAVTVPGIGTLTNPVVAASDDLDDETEAGTGAGDPE